MSHDREFLENTVTQVIAFEGNGVLDEFGGGYDDWLRYSQQKQSAKLVAKKEAAKPIAKAPNIEKSPAQKLSFNEKKELEKLPQEIEILEKEQADITAQFSNPDIYRDQPELVKKLQARLSEIEKEVETKMERWEKLEKLNE